jgi:hypothetical protein
MFMVLLVALSPLTTSGSVMLFTLYPYVMFNITPHTGRQYDSALFSSRGDVFPYQIYADINTSPKRISREQDHLFKCMRMSSGECPMSKSVLKASCRCNAAYFPSARGLNRS